MAMIMKFPKKALINKFLSNNTVCLSCNASYSKDVKPWSYLWIPKEDPPKTEKEHKEAAEKYNLHPLEYKPCHPNDGHGDYPDLPKISADARDPFYPWDMPTIRRNFNEPVHINEHLMTEDRYAYGVRKRYTLTRLLTTYITFIGTLYAIYYFIGNKYYWFQPVMEKQYPKSGVVHYTFEPAT